MDKPIDAQHCARWKAPPKTPHDAELDVLQDVVFDAFAAYWRSHESEQAEQLWAAYCELEEQMTEVFRHSRPHPQSTY